MLRLLCPRLNLAVRFGHMVRLCSSRGSFRGWVTWAAGEILTLRG